MTKNNTFRIVNKCKNGCTIAQYPTPFGRMDMKFTWEDFNAKFEMIDARTAQLNDAAFAELVDLKELLKEVGPAYRASDTGKLNEIEAKLVKYHDMTATQARMLISNEETYEQRRIDAEQRKARAAVIAKAMEIKPAKTSLADNPILAKARKIIDEQGYL